MSKGFQSFSVSKKLIFSFLAIIFITIIIGVLAFYGLTSLSNNLKELKDSSIPSIVYMSDVMESLLAIKYEVRALLSDNIAYEYKIQSKHLVESRTKYNEAIKEYDIIPRTDEEDRLYKDAIQQLQIAKKVTDEIFSLAEKMAKSQNITEEDKAKLEKLILQTYRNDIDEAINKFDILYHYIVDYYGVKIPEIAIKNSQTINFIMIVAIIFSIIIGIILAITISSSISKPLIKNSDVLNSSSIQLEGAATQVSSSSQELSSGASELASSVEEVTSSVEELQSIIESNSKNVNETELIMHQTADNNKEAIEISNDLLKAMDDITNNSKKISKINKVIDDIAFQTNILALNAAVEAARAGDAGRGFAVVAEQVKSLAQKSADAAKETNDLIDIVIESVEKGNNQVSITIENINKSKELIEKSAIMLEEVSKAFKEQAKGANQITKAMSQINSVVQQTASSSEGTASSSEEMLSQVEEMKRVVESLNAIAIGEKKAKMKQEQTNYSRKISSENIKTKKSSVKTSDNHVNISNPIKEIDVVKPEDKIPLEDFKDF